ncbi:MAG TPA: LytTR family DNA-binding domain-containing protein [Vicinamibacteria bacterium]|nr:LytTR family DNA-binding domain-containing protein [Vicinamibacteria bacterium]
MSDKAPLRVLVVDDEPLARHRIEDLLRDEPDVEVVGTSEDGLEAVETIRSLRPDLVFLDIQMPGATGLEVVSRIGPERMPATIFVTAFDEHALRAFEVAAVDYLVKPFDDERFAQALRRARERVRMKEVERMTRRLLAVLGQAPADREPTAPRPPSPAASTPYARRITVETRGQVRFVPVEAIDYVTASGPYAELHVGGQTHLIRERMQALERRLDPRLFARIHRSAIVQLDRVESLRQRPGGELAVRLRGGEELTVSRSRRRELEARMGRGRL